MCCKYVNVSIITSLGPRKQQSQHRAAEGSRELRHQPRDRGLRLYRRWPPPEARGQGAPHVRGVPRDSWGEISGISNILSKYYQMWEQSQPLNNCQPGDGELSQHQSDMLYICRSFKIFLKIVSNIFSLASHFLFAANLPLCKKGF